MNLYGSFFPRTRRLTAGAFQENKGSSFEPVIGYRFANTDKFNVTLRDTLMNVFIG